MRSSDAGWPRTAPAPPKVLSRGAIFMTRTPLPHEVVLLQPTMLQRTQWKNEAGRFFHAPAPDGPAQLWFQGDDMKTPLVQHCQWISRHPRRERQTESE